MHNLLLLIVTFAHSPLIYSSFLFKHYFVSTRGIFSWEMLVAFAGENQLRQSRHSALNNKPSVGGLVSTEFCQDNVFLSVAVGSLTCGTPVVHLTSCFRFIRRTRHRVHIPETEKSGNEKSVARTGIRTLNLSITGSDLVTREGRR